MNDKTTLARSNAGMRLIAQTTFLNQKNAERLEAFIRQSYTDNALAEEAAEARFAALQALAAQAGRLRLHQALALDKHRVIVVMRGEHGDSFYYLEMAVEEDYPHKITAYHHQLMEDGS